MVKVVVLGEVEMGREHEAKQKMLKMKGIKDVLVTYGSWTLVALIEVDTLTDLDRLITKIRKEVPEIVKTETLIGSEG